MENVITGGKVAVIVTLSALASNFGLLVVPLLILLALCIIDYFTGIAAAKYRNEQVSSYKGLKGIIKKLCLLLLVGIGAVLDWVILFATTTVGIELPFSFVVSIVVAVWLMCNEIISILENMIDIGVDMPPFLQSIAKYIRKQAELKTDIQNTESEDKQNEKNSSNN